MKLSVVLISHNQAWNIGRLIESVLRETSSLDEVEVVLVDSASSDQTTAVALEYPVRVLKLRADQRLSSHAGRYVGFCQTSGDNVLFLDGDMELYGGWLAKALSVMNKEEDVAVVDGPRIDVPTSTKSHAEVAHYKPSPFYEDWDSTTDTTKVGGAALYRRSVLNRVGPFNPWLRSDGEPELCMRIRHFGFRVVQLGHPVVYHYSDPPREWNTVIGRRSRGLYVGPGQIMRYYLGKELFWPYIRWRAYGVVPLLFMLAGALAAVLWIVAGTWLWAGLWAASLALVLAADLTRRRSLRRTLSALLERVFQAEGTIRGLLIPTLDPSEYPGRFDELR